MKQFSQVTWRNAMTFDATTATGQHVTMDSAAEGKTSHGPTPVELVMTALAGCTAMDVVSILTKMREPLEGLEVETRGVRREQEPRIFTHIEVVYHLKGKVKSESVERAIALSRSKYCTVEGMLEKSADITTRYEITP
ncbi:MAG: OsmC family protein [Anaerolineae bacterium]